MDQLNKENLAYKLYKQQLRSIQSEKKTDQQKDISRIICKPKHEIGIIELSTIFTNFSSEASNMLVSPSNKTGYT